MGFLELVYDEIDDKIQILNSSSIKTSSDNFEKNPAISTGKPPPIFGTSDFLVPINDFQREQHKKYLNFMCANMSPLI